MARASAAQRGLTIRFDLADICRMPAQPDRYDLAIDGHCLHYFVLDDHRRAALAAVHGLLKPGGLFLIETMISHPGLVVAGNYRFDSQGVRSIKVDEPAAWEGAFQSGDDWFAPYRRLLRAQDVLDELAASGFAVHHHKQVVQQDGRKPMLMQISAGLAPGSTR
jgi:SAM-dependent methyltransferase